MGWKADIDRLAIWRLGYGMGTDHPSVGRRRAGAALFASGAIATLMPLLAITFGYSLAFNRLIPRPEDRGILMMIAGAACLVGITTCVLLALPLYRYLNATKGLTLTRSALGGALVGLPASAMWLLIQSLSRDPLSRALLNIWPIALLLPGLIGGLAFWLLLRRSARSERLGLTDTFG